MNNEVLRLHERGATDYETGMILNEAVNIGEQRKINDIACLEFEYPMDEKARLIQENMLVSCTGRIYEIVRITRKMDGRDILYITCEDMFSYRAKKTFLPNVPDMIGEKTSDVIKKALKTAAKFSLYTDEELKALGMKWVGNDEFLIDFFSTDKTSLWDFLQSVIENCGRGEIYSNGYKFALVERIGSDRGVRLTLDKNMQNIDIERSTEDIITKLYPFGAEDLTIKHTKIGKDREYGKEYILSPNAKIYGVHEGCRDYSDYKKPEKVLANALWEFNGQSEKEAEDEIDISEIFKLNGNNDERIDIPKLTISGKLIDLSKLEEYGDIEKVELGDTVHVYDLDGTEYTERVIEGTWYPYEAKETVISIGHMRRDMFFTLYQLRQKKRELEKVQTTNKGITTRQIQGVVNTDRNGVQSDNELLKIVGDLLTIRDKNKKLRANLGNVGEEFAFELYDEKGNCNVYINDDGDIVIAGTLDTGKDCRIQGELRVGMAGSSMKGITFYGDSYQPDADGNYSTPYARILPYVANNEDFKGINVTGGKLCVEGSPVVTQAYIDKLENTIKELQRQINYLQDKLT